MALRPAHVNIKAVDPVAVGEFWAQALGWNAFHPGVTTYVGPRAELVWPDPDFLGIDIVPVPEPKTATTNRMRLELASSSSGHRAELLARLERLGAKPAGADRLGASCALLADPEGNEFCVPGPQETGRDTGPISAVVMDCTDPPAMARFWGAAIDWPVVAVTGERATLRSGRGTGPDLTFVRVPGTTPTLDRLHLDLRPDTGDDQAAQAVRLRALGAADLDVGQGGDVSWICLTDPDGHELCVLAAPGGESG
ncbi:VOC family protein [Micromonospora sp. NPDC049175]|uniref:VOC family protein n=1 Tax=Micromonospora sp. NPDC049175 TaxID=3364266 RepID=UPI0037145E6B